MSVARRSANSTFVNLRRAAALALVFLASCSTDTSAINGAAQRAEATAHFSDSDLIGKYTVSYASNVLGFHGDPQTEPRIGFGEIQFDGRGKVTGSDTSSRFGRDRVSFIGTYHVDSDGAGMMVITSKFQDGTTDTTRLNFKLSDPRKIRYSSPERALDPMGTRQTVGPPTGVMGTFTKE